MDEADRAAKSSRLCCVLPSFLTESCTYNAAEADSKAGVRIVTDETAAPARPGGQSIGAPARSPGAPTGSNEELSSFLKSAIAERQGGPAASPPAQKPRASPRTSPARGRSNSPHRPRSPRSVNIAMLVGELRTEASRLVTEGHPEAAELVYKEALRYNPSDFSIKAAQIECVLLQGRAQDALEEARAITAAAPHVAKAWQVEGAALEKLGQLRPAVERYQKAASVAESTGKEPALLEQCLAAAEAIQLKIGPV